MQYKVPQNVDIEDKVIAGLTLKQFIYLIVAGGGILMLNTALPSFLRFLFMPLAVIIGGTGVAFAFLKINDRPLENFIISAAKTFIMPNRRVWKKEIITEKEDIPTEMVKKEEVPKKQSVGEIKTNLERLAMIVDAGAPEYAENRITNVKETDKNSGGITDILKETESNSERMKKLIARGEKIAATKNIEPTIGQITQNKTNKEQFKYEELALKDEKDLEEMLKKAEEKQKEKEINLENQKIIKH